jgi:hypothetical protein
VQSKQELFVVLWDEKGKELLSEKLKQEPPTMEG